MIKTILVATDDSAHARKAVDYASDLARHYNARLIVLHSLLRDATSDTLRKLANRRALSKEHRHLLDNYEVDMQLALAGSALDGALTPVPAPIELLNAIGRQIVDRAAQAAKKRRVKRVTTALSGGEPADAILKTAKRQKVGLIVMGTRGFGEIRGMLLGSVSHKVVSQASCPVMTVK